jgi:hypothetical protein
MKFPIIVSVVRGWPTMMGREPTIEDVLVPTPKEDAAAGQSRGVIEMKRPGFRTSGRLELIELANRTHRAERIVRARIHQRRAHDGTGACWRPLVWRSYDCLEHGARPWSSISTPRAAPTNSTK